MSHSCWLDKSLNAPRQGLDAMDSNPRISSSAALYTSAARASIRLIRYIPVRGLRFLWSVLYFPLSALETLFVNILQNPTDLRARSDLRLIGSFVDFLSKLQSDYSHVVELTRILRVCSDFERVAKEVIEKAENDSQSWMERSWFADDTETGKQQSPFQYSALLTPNTAMDGSYEPPLSLDSRYNSPAEKSSALSMTTTGIELNQFTNHLPIVIGGSINPYSEIQAMFPPDLVPWNMSTLHNSAVQQSFSRQSYDFDGGVNI